MSGSGVWRGRLRRWRWLIAAIALAIGVRVALPEVIRRVAISQASQNLRARVELGNVDLSLWRGGIVLEDFALRPLDLSDEPEAATRADGAPPSGAPPLPPIVAWKRLALGVSFRPLWNKTIQLYEVALDSPQIALDRLADGQLNVMSILPPAEVAAAPATAPPSPAAPAAETGGWRYGIDRLAIGTGKLVFRDLMVADSEPIEIGIPSVEISDIALDPQVYGGPLNSRVKILLDEGSIELGARLALAGDTTTLEAEVEAHSLPLRRSRLYIPEVGWSDLHGLLDASLKYQLQTGTRNEVRGEVSLRDVAVAVPRLPDAALSWKALTVRVDPIDLLAQSAHVTEVDLNGAVLTVDPQSADRLPVLERQKAAAAAAQAEATPEETAATPPPTPPATPAAEDAVEAKPWRWSVDSVRLSDSLVRLLTPSTPFDVGVRVQVGHLVDKGEEPASVDVGLTLGDGTIAVTGNARVEPPGFGGKLVITKLSVPELIAASAALPDSPLLAAQLDTDLGIAAGMPAPGATVAIAPQDLRLTGTISVSEARIAPPGMKDVGVGLRQLGITLAQLDLPGMLAILPEGAAPPPDKGDLGLQGDIRLAEPKVTLADGKEFLVGAKEIRIGIAKLDLPAPAAEGTAARPKIVTLREVRLDEPLVRLTRTEKGLIIPGAESGAAEGAPAPSPAAAAATPAAELVAAEPKAVAAQPASPPAIDFRLASFQLTKGRIDVTDRSVKPTFNGGLSSLEVRARDIRWPKLAVRQLKLDTRTPGSGEIHIQGDLTAEGGAIQFDGRNVDLPSLNPYAVAYSPFKIGGGALTLSTKVTFKGDSYVVGNSVTLHQFDLTGKEGESLFEQNFGVPLSTALALLRDAQGDIAMDIPLQVDREGTKIDIVGIAGGALRRALVNALTSPLRLLGAVTGSGDKVESIAPASVAFRRGRAETAADGEKRLEQVGNFLASRPALAVELETQATDSDVRWLREQALLKTWDEQGFFSSLLARVQGGDARERIQQALGERSADGAGKLSDEDAKTLDDWLAQQPPVAPEQLAALVQARLALAQTAVTRNVEAARVIVIPAAGEMGDGDPELRLKLRPVGGSNTSGDQE